MITELVTDMITNKDLLLRLCYQFTFKKGYKPSGVIGLDAETMMGSHSHLGMGERSF
jgi:hypothetical protein